MVLSADSLLGQTFTVTASELERDAFSNQPEKDFIKALRILGQYPGTFD